MTVAGEIARVARAERTLWAEPAIVVDDVEVRGGVVDRVRELDEFRRILPFNAGSRARRRDEYPNGRSEAWFAFAEKLPELDLDADEQLIADLVAPRYSIDTAAVSSSRRRRPRNGSAGRRTVPTRCSWHSRYRPRASTGGGVGTLEGGSRGSREELLALRRDRALARLDRGDKGPLGYGNPL